MLKEDPTVNKIMEQAYLSTRSMCKLFFGDTFSAPFSTLHDQIFDAID